MHIFDHSAHVLINTGAQRSFISESFARHSNCDLVPLEEELLIRTPLGEDLVRKVVYRNCDLKIGEVKLEVDLIPLELHDFDAILGMDWLERHHAIVNCFKKTVMFCKPEVLCVADLFDFYDRYY